ncbi:unnamed protein product [Absidia cylindrospora]
MDVTDRSTDGEKSLGVNYQTQPKPIKPALKWILKLDFHRTTFKKTISQLCREIYVSTFSALSKYRINMYATCRNMELSPLPTASTSISLSTTTI